MAPHAAPATIQRTPFDRWLWERDIDNAVAGQRIGVHAETVRKYRLPFGHRMRRVPAEATLTEIFAWTAGEITPAHFYPPELRRPAEAAGLQAAGAAE